MRTTFFAQLLFFVVLLWQPAVAQTSLPACTASLADDDNDGVAAAVDIDKDNDGLIEICDLEGLNEIRHQSDGSGYKASADAQKNTSGCPSWGCMGYELVRSLDFNSATNYRNGSINTDWTVADYADDRDHGWHPLPGLRAVFNGNGYIIRNLQINSVNHKNAGLFGAVHRLGRVENIELVYPNVRGLSNVGGLVGDNNGVVSNSYVRDYDTDASTRDTSKYIEAISGSVGGLVGRNNGGGANIGDIINSGAVINVQIKQNMSAIGIDANAGGLAGFNTNGAEIHNSYARGTVKGPCGVGGLTANNFSTVPSDSEKNSKIINSYATGNVTTGFGKCKVAGNVRSGGLAAVNNGLISNSYTTSCWDRETTGSVGSNQRGGVVQNNSGTISNSYYQTTTGCSGLQPTPSGSDKTQTQLQAPVATDSNFSSGIYQAWALSEWDFGDNSQYPAIRYTPGPDKDNPGCGYHSLPDCDDLLKNQLPVDRTVTSSAPAALINLDHPLIDGFITFEIDVPVNIKVDTIRPDKYEGATFFTFPGALMFTGASHETILISKTCTTTAEAPGGGERTRIYQYNFIPVLSIPASPLPPTQPSENSKGMVASLTATISIDGDEKMTKIVPDYDIKNFNYDIYFQSDYAMNMPDSILSTVNSEVNSSPATLTDDGVMLVKLGDTVGVNAAGSFVVEYGISRPLNYGWYISSGPTLFSGELRGKTISFDINDNLFRNSQSGDAVLTLALHDKYNPVATPVTKQIPIRILDRLVLTSSFGEVMQDQAASTLHRVVLAPDQPQTVITARSLNEAITLTVDDSATNITAVNGGGTSTSSMITLQVDEGSETEFTITATDSDGTAVTHTVRVFRRSGVVSPPMDDDNDGLIDIYTLEDLDEIRNQYTNMPSTCGSNSNITCEGFELRQSLDFNAADSYQDNTVNTEWTTGDGWLPIANNSVRFDSVFEGNGFTISGLYINRSFYDEIGLFAVLGNGVVKNVGLLDVSIVGADNIGGLMGRNFGLIINSYVTSVNIGGDNAFDAGGLVGHNDGSIINSYATTATVLSHADTGGLVGFNGGDIISSFAYADVIGRRGRSNRTGGLVGANSGNIINAYAVGTVVSTQTTARSGGLVGSNTRFSEIRNSYAISRMMSPAGSQVDGLAGDDNGTIAASYWDKTVNADLTISDNARTTAELQNPTMPGATSADTYHGWDTAAWDFGDSIHYPTLYYATTDSITVSACADNPPPSSALPRCGSRIPNQAVRNLIPDLPALEVSEITMSSQPAASADGTINEGSNVSLMVNATGESESYSYTWSQTSGRTLELENSTSTTLSFTIPSDFVELDATTAVITFQVEVSDGMSTTSRSAIITINKINNGNPTIAVDVDVNAARLRIIATASDTDGAGSFSYQWQQLVSGGWMDITAATTATYWLPADEDARIQYRVKIKHTDGQGYTTDYPIQGPFRVRIDDDNNGLIDIYTLEDLDEIRNQYRNIPSTCGSNADLTCDGFELRRSLDFNAAESYQSGMIDPNWTTSTGWTPIGSADEHFNRVFEGNDFTISGLYINRSGRWIGLFSRLGSGSEIKNVGLLDAEVKGARVVGGLVGLKEDPSDIINSYVSGAVSGNLSVGGLVGANSGSIINSYANVVVTATGDGSGGLVGKNQSSSNIINSYASGAVSGSSRVGGLVGQHAEDANIINSYATGTVTGTHWYIGGLVGWNEPGAHIINSYASGAVRGSFDVGGLVGWHQGRLRNTYATGDVSLTSTSDERLGGLVGHWSSSGSIRNSYAIGRVIPGTDNARNAGGLIGITTGTVVSSYWDGEASDWNISAGGVTSRTTMELQSPIAPGMTAMDVYYGWRDNDWDFGSSQEYPALRYVAGGMNACNADMSTASDLPQCGSLLPNQGRTKEVVLAVSEVTLSSQPAANNDGTINEGSNVSLMVNVISGSGTYNFAWSQTSGKALVLTTTNTATLNVAIPPDFIAEDAATTMLTFTVMVNDGMSTISRSKMITITKASLAISGVMLSAATIAEGSTATVTFDVSGGTGIYRYAYKLIAGADEIALPSLAPPAVLVIPTDIVAAADRGRVVKLNIIVSDDRGQSVEHNEELTIQKVDNGLANIEASRATSRTLTVKVGIDPDGDATTPNYAYQWQLRAAGGAQWMGISGENDASYTISDDLVETSGEFRVQVIYTDGQDYQVMLTSNEISYVPPSELSPLIASDIRLSVQPPANADGTINEGSTATLTFDVSGGTGIYQYAYKLIAGADEIALPSLAPPAVLVMPVDIVAATDSKRVVKLNIIVSDDRGQSVEHNEELTIQKVDNGLANIEASRATSRTLTVKVGIDPDGDATTPNYAYQWQLRAAGGAQWMGISGENDASYTISDDLVETSGEFRVQVIYTDGQDYQVMLTSNEISYVPPSELSPLIASDIRLSVQPPANADGTINEGSTATLTFDVSGGTGIYQYAYKLIAGADEIALPSLAPPAVLVMPVDIVAATDSKRVVKLNIIVSDDGGQRVEHNEELTIQKVDNGLANIEANRATSRTLTVKVGIDPDGDATTPNYAYQWQLRTAEGAQWMDISGENDASYMISDDLAETSGEFRVQVIYTDGQDYQVMLTSNEISYVPPSELPPLVVSDIRLSVQPSVNADGTINEGSAATLTFNVSGGTDVYQYESKIDDAAYTPFQLPFMYSIADDLIATDATSQTVRVIIKVIDQSDEIEDFEHTEELHIRKTNNGSADINISITNTTLTAIIGADPDGDATTPNYVYQWQQLAPEADSQWMDIDAASAVTYLIPDNTPINTRFRVLVTYTDGQGYRKTRVSREIRYIAQFRGLRIRTKVFLEGPLR